MGFLPVPQIVCLTAGSLTIGTCVMQGPTYYSILTALVATTLMVLMMGVYYCDEVADSVGLHSDTVLAIAFLIATCCGLYLDYVYTVVGKCFLEMKPKTQWTRLITHYLFCSVPVVVVLILCALDYDFWELYAYAIPFQLVVRGTFLIAVWYSVHNFLQQPAMLKGSMKPQMVAGLVRTAVVIDLYLYTGAAIGVYLLDTHAKRQDFCGYCVLGPTALLFFVNLIRTGHYFVITATNLETARPKRAFASEMSSVSTMNSTARSVIVTSS